MKKPKRLKNSEAKDFSLESAESLLDRLIELIKNTKFDDAKDTVAEIGFEVVKEAKLIKFVEAGYRGYQNIKTKKMIANIDSFLNNASFDALFKLYEMYDQGDIIDQIIFDVLDSAAPSQATVISHLINALARGDINRDEFDELVYATKQINPSAFEKVVSLQDGDSGWLQGGMTPHLMSQGLAYGLSENPESRNNHQSELVRSHLTNTQAEVYQNKYTLTPLGSKYIKFAVKPYQRKGFTNS